MNDNQSVSILRTFKGLYDTGRSEPDPQGLASRFSCIRPRAGGDVPFKTEHFVIREKARFQRFVDRIPDHVMEFVPDPDPSDDPLLKRPEIDFENHMVLVIISSDPNRMIALDIIGVELAANVMRVHCHHAQPGPVIQKVIGYGSYCAVVVRRFDGQVVFGEE